MHAECGGRRKDETWLPLHTAQDSCISDGRKKTQIVYSTCSSNPQTHDFNLPKASVQYHLPCSPSSMWIWADRHFWKKSQGILINSSLLSTPLIYFCIWNILFCFVWVNSTCPYLLGLFLLSSFCCTFSCKGSRLTGRTQSELRAHTRAYWQQSGLTVMGSTPWCCSWKNTSAVPGTMTVSDITSHFLWPYCKHPLLLTTNLLNHSLKSIFFTLSFTSFCVPSSLSILIARYPPFPIFSLKLLKRKQIKEEN